MAKKERSIRQKILSILGIIAIVILSIILAANLTLLIKGAVDDENAPSIFGVTPLVTLSASMEGEKKDSFGEGSLVFVKSCNADSLQEGDVISFYDPASKTRAIVTHRIYGKTEVDGELAFYTKGDANNTGDELPVKATEVIGVYFFHLEGIGNFALFLQKPLGMLIFIGIPLLSFIIYDITRRSIAGKKKDKTTEELQAEIERLRALTEQAQNEKNNDSENN